MNASTQVAGIQDGDDIALDLNGAQVEVRIRDVCQRNWSRVAIGELREPAPDQGQEPQASHLFVKQFLDRRGEPHADHMHNELAGCRAATAIAAPGVRVMPVVATNESDMVLCYPWQKLITPDELLRTEQSAFASRIDALVELSRTLLGTFAHCPAAVAAELKSKHRNYGSAPQALNLKGLDIRNWAWPCSSPGAPMDGAPLMFDCGRPYLAPIEEAAAKLLVSFGLLNWGWPMRRFWRGPDAELLQKVVQRFDPFVDRNAVLAEIDLQERIRMGEFQGRNMVARLGKRLTVEVVGRRYLRRLRSLCTNLPVTKPGAA